MSGSDVGVRERGIIFSGPMVRALLDGTKTQTRRVVSFENSDVLGCVSRQLWDSLDWSEVYPDRGYAHWQFLKVKAPDDTLFRVRWRGEVGTRLWVRETWADTNGENGPMISYRAGGDRFLVDDSYPVDYTRYPGCAFSMWCGDLRRGAEGHAWRSPIHMPRWASRITLEVTDVRVQRLTEISEADAWAEGFPDPDGKNREYEDRARYWYRHLWDSINAKRPGCAWDDSPWVWALSFRAIEQEPEQAECAARQRGEQP
jgi:hypothetical protein